MLLTLGEILNKVKDKNQAIGHFNFHNLEYLQAIVTAGSVKEKPVILGITESPLAYMGMEYVVSCARTAARINDIPICLHLDHGHDLDTIFKAMETGFSSVMYDGSSLPLEENMANTIKIVNKAKEYNISVEAELGMLKGREDGDISIDSVLTNPEEAEYFVQKTGIDVLAVAIGTAHGFYKGEPRIDFDRLKAINKVVAVPLALHGGSGVPDKSVRKAIERGIRKVNVGTALKLASSEAIKKVFKNNPEEIELVNYMKPARKAMEAKVIEKINLISNKS